MRAIDSKEKVNRSRLAQLVEHRSYEPKVTGSDPVSRIWEHGKHPI